MVFDSQDIGTRWDAPATEDQLSDPPLDSGVQPPTLFALLKGILLALIALNDPPDTTA